MPTWLHHPLPTSQCIPNFFKDLVGRRKVEEPPCAIPPRQSRVGDPRKDHERTQQILLLSVHPEQPIRSHGTMPSAKAVGTSRTNPLDGPIGPKITWYTSSNTTRAKGQFWLHGIKPPDRPRASNQFVDCSIVLKVDPGVLSTTILSLIESSRPPKTMDDSVQLLVGVKYDAELDWVKQAVKDHEHGEERKTRKEEK
ncbi:MAG: hypothetical protein Q9192_007280 [Flavoplaca navasiana]